MVCAWICCDNNSCTCNGKTHHQKLIWRKKYVWTYYGTYNKSSGRNVCNRCRNGYYTSLHRYKAEEKKMIEILTPDDVSKIKDCYIAEYIKNLLTNLLTQTSDCLLETVGGIFYVENEKDFDNYKKFGLSSKIIESRFEWIDLIGNDFLDGCIVLDNDRAINIVGKADYFRKGVLNYEYGEHN